MPVTDDLRIKFAAYRLEIEAATSRLREQQRQLDAIRETGKVVTGELEDAFRKWTSGAKLDVRSMIQSMLADLALLTFRRSVTDNLGSLFTSGASSLMSSLGLGGARADGGPVSAGVPYLVGERRPEVFVPDVSGNIIPSLPAFMAQTSTTNASSSTYAPVIHIDARGATPDAVRALEARIPSLVVSTMREAGERGVM